MMEVLDNITFDNTACSVEYLHNCSRSDVFAVGTYELTETKVNDQGRINEQIRKGECIIYDTSNNKFDVVARVNTPGTLDMKWSYKHNDMDDSRTIALVDADGYLTMHNFNCNTNELNTISTVDCKSDASSSALALSLDWSNIRDFNNHPYIITTLSDGRAVIVDTQTEAIVNDWKAHDYECWIGAWDHYANNNIVYTGADDCLLKSWDLRVGTEMPVLTNKRFEGGVTTIANSPHDENILAVGSYDEQLRIFDKRNLRNPLYIHKTSGGIWRIKFDEQSPTTILMANMYGGFDVLDTVKRETTYVNKSHESIAYGIDFNPNGKVTSASFYDKRGILWRLPN